MVHTRDKVTTELEQLNTELSMLSDDIQRTSSQIDKFKSQLQSTNQSSLPKFTDKAYLEQIMELGPPSAVEKEGLLYIQTAHGENKPIFLCNFPTTAQPPLPLTLMYPVFG
ncbi:hypothetical protein GOP47_0013044 [Adiantum capillus-veneris]|uniref:Uncharacterized protein n=1 Tax=Adiantum capillus-veneris TaxID=13818 RepID=A0A9D4ZEX3_ADICA|nr:hypothetical protein GOP47_0013044 [Adiantum capillus-veneris]